MDIVNGNKNMENKNKNRAWFDFRKSLSFVDVDRKQEDKDVAEFQKSNDNALLEKIYNRRIPSLQIWARRYGYLLNDSDDMYEELTYHLIKAIHGFKPKRGSFNTFLFTTFLNCVRNINSSKKAKKRTPKNYDPNSGNNFILSLDFNYNKDGSEVTLKDVISDQIKTKNEVVDDICLQETINILSHDHPHMENFFKRLSDGNTISSLIKELKTKTGKISISRSMAKRLNTNRFCNRMVSTLIKDKINIDDFKLIDYKIISPTKLHYTIERKKANEADNIIKSIKNIRKNKSQLLNKINKTKMI